MRFSILDLFSVTLFAAMLAWIEAPTNGPAIFAYACFIGLVAVFASVRFRHNRPLYRSILTVTAFFACSLAFWWMQLWIGYFLRDPQQNAQPYWEDGMIAEGFIYPLVFFAVYAPFVIAIALFVSAATIAILNFTGGR